MKAEIHIETVSCNFEHPIRGKFRFKINLKFNNQTFDRLIEAIVDTTDTNTTCPIRYIQIEAKQ